MKPFKGRAAILLALLLAAAASVRAEVKILDVQLGYDGAYRNGWLTPVSVEMTNPGPEDVQGVLSIRVPIERSEPLVFSREVDMPATAHKRVFLYPRFDPDWSNQDPVLVFRPKRGAAQEFKLEGRGKAATDVLVLVCTDAAEGSYQFMKTIDTAKWWPAPAPTPAPTAPGPGPMAAPAGGASPGFGTVDVEVAYVTTELLPDQWKGYEGLDLVLLDEFSPQAVTEAQSYALLNWVAAGGRLMVTGGAEYKRLSDSFIGDYLPIEVNGTQVLETGVPALSDSFGGAMPAAPTAVCVGTHRRGRLHLEQDGVPLVASCDVGLGRIWMTTFSFTDRPVLDWAAASGSGGSAEMLSKIIRTGRQYPPSFIGYHNEPRAAYGAAVHGGAKPPSFKVISIFLLLYIVCLIPLNYLVLKKLDRRELAWATTPAIVVVFSVAAYGLGFQMKGSDVRVRSASVVEVQASTGSGAGQSYYSVFSPRRASYTFSVAQAPYMDANAPSTRNPSRGYYHGSTDEGPRLNTEFEVRAGARDAVQDLSIQMWDQRVMGVRTPVVMPGGLGGTLRLSANSSLEGDLTNDLGVALEDAVVSFRGQQSPLGALPAGETVSVALKGPFPPTGAQDPDPQPMGWGDPFATSMHPGSMASHPSSGGPTPRSTALASELLSDLNAESALTKDVRDLREAVIDAYVQDGRYAYPDREALVLGWTDADVLGLESPQMRGAKVEASTLVIVHVAVRD